MSRYLTKAEADARAERRTAAIALHAARVSWARITFEALDALHARVAQAVCDAQWQAGCVESLRECGKGWNEGDDVQAARQGDIDRLGARAERLQALEWAMWNELERRRRDEPAELEGARSLRTFFVEVVSGKAAPEVHRIRESAACEAAWRALFAYGQAHAWGKHDYLPSSSEKGSDLFGEFEAFHCNRGDSSSRHLATATVRTYQTQRSAPLPRATVAASKGPQLALF